MQELGLCKTDYRKPPPINQGQLQTEYALHSTSTQVLMIPETTITNKTNAPHFVPASTFHDTTTLPHEPLRLRADMTHNYAALGKINNLILHCPTLHADYFLRYHCPRKAAKPPYHCAYIFCVLAI